jgi:hypothetical protein
VLLTHRTFGGPDITLFERWYHNIVPTLSTLHHATRAASHVTGYFCFKVIQIPVITRLNCGYLLHF